MTTIIEVLRRAEQGRTEPFVCRGDDDRIYYVKGKHAGLGSLCREWVAGSLARDVGMTVPEFVMAEVPQALIEQSDREDIRELGAGTVFASVCVDNAREIGWEDASRLPASGMAEVLFFDLWIQNEDRTLSEKGGNPNLLVTHEPEIWEGEATGALMTQPWMIDFNLAFDPDFDRGSFFSNHVFGSLLKQWPDGFKERMLSQIKWALHAELPRYFAQLPEEWLYIDGDDSLPVQLDQNAVFRVLNIPIAKPDAFWNLRPL